jgi:hypothetical protein
VVDVLAAAGGVQQPEQEDDRPSLANFLSHHRFVPADERGGEPALPCRQKEIDRKNAAAARTRHRGHELRLRNRVAQGVQHQGQAARPAVVVLELADRNVPQDRRVGAGGLGAGRSRGAGESEEEPEQRRDGTTSDRPGQKTVARIVTPMRIARRIQM